MQRAIVWMISAQVLTAALQFVAQVIAARLLSVEQVGIYFAALAVLGLLALLQTTGLQAFVIRNEHLSVEVRRTATTLNTVISGATAVALVIIGYAFFRANQADLGQAVAGIALVPILTSVAFAPAAMLERERRFQLIAVITALSAVTTALTTIAMLVLDVGFMSLILGQWVGAAVAAITYIAVAREHFDLRPRIRGWRPIAVFSGQSLAISGVSNLGLRISDIVLARVQGLSGLALYSRASNLNGIIWNNIHLVLGRVMFANFAASHRAGESLRHRYLLTVDVLTSLLWPMFACLGVVAGPLVATLYGTKWLPAATPLTLIAVSSILQVSVTMTWELFTATGRMQFQARIEFIRATAGTLLFVAACFVSLEAAATARIAESLITAVLYRRYINEMTSTSTREYLRIYGRSTVLTSVTVAPCAALMIASGWSPQTSVILLAAALGVGAVLWVIASLVMKTPTSVLLRSRMARSRQA